MPGQRGISARRSRGSWALRIAGTVLAIATAATVASVLVVTQGTARARRQSAPSLPRHVLSTVAIGLLNPGPPPRRDSRPVPGQLYLSATGLAFAPSGRPSQASAAGEWTAARMSGGTYILIYVPDGRCLTAPSSPAAQRPARRVRRGHERMQFALAMAAGRLVPDRVLTPGRVAGGCGAGRPQGPRQPKIAGRAWLCAAPTSSSGMLNRPAATRLEPPVMPITAAGTPCSAHSSVKPATEPGSTATTARAADSLNRLMNGSPGRVTVQPVRPARQHSASATASPPSDRSCAVATRPPAAPAASTDASRRSAARSTAGGRPPTCPCATLAHNEPPNSGAVRPSSSTLAPASPKPIDSRRLTSSCTPSTPTTGVGWIAAPPVWL